MDIPLRLRLFLIFGAALIASPSLALADPSAYTPESADTSAAAPTAGDRTILNSPARAAAPAAPPAPVALPPPATVVQSNADAAAGFSQPVNVTARGVVIAEQDKFMIVQILGGGRRAVSGAAA